MVERYHGRFIFVEFASQIIERRQGIFSGTTLKLQGQIAISKLECMKQGSRTS